jgi:hypothetical protein
MVVSRYVEDAPEELPCARCGHVKSVNEFPVTTARGKKQYWSYCVPCRNNDARDRRKADLDSYHARESAYYRKNRDRILENGRLYRDPERQRAAKLFKAYNLTPGEFQDLLNSQDGACAICKRTSSGVEGRNFHVDHDHVTGVVRGLLCQTCNVGIGALHDDVNLLRAALAYLERSVMS